MSIRRRMEDILAEKTGPDELENAELWKALAGVATLLYDSSDNSSVDAFLADLKSVVSRDRSRFRALLRRYTPSKAKRTLRSVERKTDAS